MAVAGHKTVIKRIGLATLFTDEVMDAFSTVNNRYKINDATKDVFDRTTGVTFKSSATGTTISSTDILDINFLFGRVTFKTTHAASVVGSGTFLPVSNIAGAHSYTLTQSNGLLDDTDFSSTGNRTRTPGLQDITLSVSRWDTLSTVANAQYFDDHIMNTTGSEGTTRALIELIPGGTTAKTARGWFIVESHNRSGGVADLESGDVELSLDADNPVRAGDKINFGWSDQ